MDCDRLVLEGAPRSSWVRFGIAVTTSTLIMVVTSLFISTGPSVGYRAGHDAVTTKGLRWIEAAIGAGGGTALAACNALTTHAVDAADYSDFVSGCSSGIDEMYGRHVPMLGGGE